MAGSHQCSSVGSSHFGSRRRTRHSFGALAGVQRSLIRSVDVRTSPLVFHCPRGPNRISTCEVNRRGGGRKFENHAEGRKLCNRQLGHRSKRRTAPVARSHQSMQMRNAERGQVAARSPRGCLPVLGVRPDLSAQVKPERTAVCQVYGAVRPILRHTFPVHTSNSLKHELRKP